jgi:hypothetical protein
VCLITFAQQSVDLSLDGECVEVGHRVGLVCLAK